MKTFDVTFVIQNRNYGKYLKQCLTSILTQNGLDKISHEIIGMDAGSVDDSRDIYRDILGEFLDVSKLSQAEALNHALKKCRGKYLAWINSDDYYLPNYLQLNYTIFKSLEADGIEDISVIYSDAVIQRDYSFRDCAKILRTTSLLSLRRFVGFTVRRFFSPFYTEVRRQNLPVSAFKENKNIVCQPATMIKKCFFTEVGGWDETLNYVIDKELWIRLLQISKFVYLPRPTAVRRIHGHGLGFLRRQKEIEEGERVLARYQNLQLHDRIVWGG